MRNPHFSNLAQNPTVILQPVFVMGKKDPTSLFCMENFFFFNANLQKCIQNK